MRDKKMRNGKKIEKEVRNKAQEIRKRRET